VNNPDTVDVPKSWRIEKIGDIYDSWGGLTPSKANSKYWGEGVAWVSSKDVKSRRIAASTHTVTRDAIAETGLRVCPPGTVLVVVRSGVLAHTLPVAVTEVPVAINQDLKAFHSEEPFLNEWLALFLRRSARNLLASSRRDGTTVQSVQYPLLKNTLIPVPPVEQRQRIVRFLEEARSTQDRIAPRVEDAQALVENYRRAVLVSACAGKLTDEWRRNNPEARVVDLTKLKLNKKRRREGKAPIAEVEVPEFPDSYVVASLSDVAERLEYGTSRKANGNEQDIPILRMGNIQDGILDLDDLKYITSDDEIERLLLKSGDLLFNRTNSPELVGKSAVWRGQGAATFASYLIRVRFREDVVIPEFANYWINSSWGRLWARRVKTDGVSQSNINGTKLGDLVIPIPPLDEQVEIVRVAESLLLGSKAILGQLGDVELLLERAEQAVLAKAFRGEFENA
jgi:type I restriction enzyme S subunit